jgi:hypothetical protein
MPERAPSLGLKLQQQARTAFSNGDCRVAYSLYQQAAAEYRRFYATAGDRVFFMENSALRCLEELLEDNPELYSTYTRDARLHLNAWTLEAISGQISRGRQPEALRLPGLASDSTESL